jgi:hypothetical protein
MLFPNPRVGVWLLRDLAYKEQMNYETRETHESKSLIIKKIH